MFFAPASFLLSLPFCTRERCVLGSTRWQSQPSPCIDASTLDRANPHPPLLLRREGRGGGKGGAFMRDGSGRRRLDRGGGAEEEEGADSVDDGVRKGQKGAKVKCNSSRTETKREVAKL